MEDAGDFAPVGRGGEATTIASSLWFAKPPGFRLGGFFVRIYEANKEQYQKNFQKPADCVCARQFLFWGGVPASCPASEGRHAKAGGYRLGRIRHRRGDVAASRLRQKQSMKAGRMVCAFSFAGECGDRDFSFSLAGGLAWCRRVLVVAALLCAPPLPDKVGFKTNYVIA